MKIKTNALLGAALDWAVATAAKVPVTLVDNEIILMGNGSDISHEYLEGLYPGDVFQPTEDGALGVQFIKHERIDVFSVENGNSWCSQSNVRVFNGYGKTPLHAVMRCYVASKLGNEVEVPDELVSS